MRTPENFARWSKGDRAAYRKGYKAGKSGVALENLVCPYRVPTHIPWVRAAAAAWWAGARTGAEDLLEEQPAPSDAEIETTWAKDCQTWRGGLLTGRFQHYCYDWDGLPIDETCMEWPCACAESLGATAADIAAGKAAREAWMAKHQPPIDEQAYD